MPKAKYSFESSTGKNIEQCEAVPQPEENTKSHASTEHLAHLESQWIINGLSVCHAARQINRHK